MELESSPEPVQKIVHHNAEVRAKVTKPERKVESRISIQQWATDRLDRSRGQLESLGAYMSMEMAKDHTLDVASEFERGYLEFYERPIEV